MYPKNGEMHLLLNKRSESVEDHKGEVSFPGGRMDEGDGSLLETALREAHEEIGVRPDDVQTLGELDEVDTMTGYRVSPFVGAIRGGYPFVINEVEVAELVEIPLSALFDGSAVRDEVRRVDGVWTIRENYAYGGSLVWGATARIVSGLLDMLRSPDAERLSPILESLRETEDAPRA